jgi:hypothetical protein
VVWLKPGANRFGTDKGKEIVLSTDAVPSARALPPYAGSFLVDDQDAIPATPCRG